MSKKYSNPLEQVNSLILAEKIIFDTYGDQVSVWQKAKTLRKFGRNVAVGGYTEVFDPPIIVPRNSDLRVRARSDGTSVDCGASFAGYLAAVIE